MIRQNRRDFLRDLGIGAAALPFVLNLPSLGFANQARPKQRLIVLFSPNGVVQPSFWPDEEGGQFSLKESLTPLAPFQDRTLILKGVCDKVRGDGDNHMRGIGCLLTGIELFPGNVQGGSHTRQNNEPGTKALPFHRHGTAICINTIERAMERLAQQLHLEGPPLELASRGKARKS